MVSTTLHSILVPMVVDNVSALDFSKDNFPEVEIGGDEFCVVAVRKDITVLSVDNSASTHDYASRVHIDCFPKSTAILDIDLQVRTTAVHIFVSCYRADGSRSDNTVVTNASEVILDIDALRQEAGTTTSLPLCARNNSHHVGNVDADALKTRYEAYIGAINGRRMSQTLPDFCHDVVIHNGKSLPLVEYQRLMEDAQAIILDLEFNIANSLVDFDRQILAAKIDFRGTPIGEFAGVTPLEGVRKEVRFSEMVFYWFRDGKIAEVVSLVDLAGYRNQVSGQR